MLSESIAKLVQYGVETELIPECERNYTTNLLLDVFYEDDYTAPEQEFQNIELEKVLDELLKEAIDRGLIEDSVVYKLPHATTCRSTDNVLEKIWGESKSSL